MTTRFNATNGLIVVNVRLNGPASETYARMALDTGATTCTLNAAKFLLIGYDPSILAARVRMTTGSNVEYAPLVVVKTVTALGLAMNDVDVICHTLPPSATVDGLLGLNFLRGRKLTVDFVQGAIELV